VPTAVLPLAALVARVEKRDEGWTCRRAAIAAGVAADYATPGAAAMGGRLDADPTSFCIAPPGIRTLRCGAGGG